MIARTENERDGSAGKARGDPRGVGRAEPPERARRRRRNALRAAWREVSTGTN
jgi:hypothetical protein